jgi:hypothetical protein
VEGDAVVSGYVRGKLALAGVDLSSDLRTWLDAAWACYIDAPVDTLKGASHEMTKAMARVRPETARETWGLLPEHQAAAGRLGRTQGLEADAARVQARGGGSTAADVERWKQEQMSKRPRRR